MSRKFYKFKITLATIVLLLVATIQASNAEQFRFIETRSNGNVYQLNSKANDYTVQVVVVKNKGFWLSWQDPEHRVPLQEYQPIDLDSRHSKGLFISYKNRYSQLTIGRKSWSIRGNVTFQDPAGFVITIDANNGYLTIMKYSKGSTKARAMLGFVGNNVVANIFDEEGKRPIVPLLVANSYSNLIAPYHITSNGLRLNGKNVSTSTSVGLDFKPSGNKCANQEGMTFLTKEVFDKVLAQQDSVKSRKILQEALKNQTNPLDTLIKLIQTNSYIVGIDLEKNQIIKVTSYNNTCIYKVLEVL